MADNLVRGTAYSTVTPDPAKEEAPYEEEPYEEEPYSFIKAVVAVGLVISLVLIFIIMVWPTRYRYEVWHRCVFKYSAPYTNEDWGKVAGAKRFKRTVTSTVTNESYRIDRVTGEMFVPGKVQGQEGWKLMGLAYENPGEFLEGGIKGTANTGCKLIYEAYEQSDTPDAPDESWEEVKPGSNDKPSPSPTK
jgi:hypothetical protein